MAWRPASIYADSRGMLEDRVSALRKANIYERQRYRHIVGLPAVLGQANGAAEVETPFLIVRIMRDGKMEVFATGCYHDKVAAGRFQARCASPNASWSATAAASTPWWRFRFRGVAS